MGTHPIFESDFDCLTDMAALGRLAKTILPAGLAGGAAYMLASTAVSNNAKAQAEQARREFEAGRTKVSISVCDE